MALVQVAWQRYMYQLNKRPLQTKACTSGVIAGLSDVIAQQIISGSYSNWRRTVALFLYGFIWNGPTAHYWQMFMGYSFKGSSLWTVLKKVLIDQSTYGPLCNIAFMSYATLILEGRSVRFLKKKLRTEYPKVQLSGWRVWPLAALINYAFVPMQFRVLFINFIALGWTIFLLMRAKAIARALSSLAIMPPGSAANLPLKGLNGNKSKGVLGEQGKQGGGGGKEEQGQAVVGGGLGEGGLKGGGLKNE